MAVYKVGQRVRLIAYCKDSLRRVPLGTEGIIIFHDGRPGIGLSGIREALEYRIQIADGTVVQCDGWQLEPIVDDGRQVITWDACVWRPEVKENDRVSS